MRTVQQEAADVAQARAYQIGDVLLLMAAGEKPTPCHVVTLERSMLDVEPPAFIARLSTDPRMRCARVIVAYEVHAAFEIGAPRDHVVIHHRGGELPVEVQRVEPQPGINQASTGLPEPAPTTVIGYSRSYDVAEAVRDALDKVAPSEPSIPDWLSTYTVDWMRIERGGIAGFDHLAVQLTG